MSTRDICCEEPQEQFKFSQLEKDLIIIAESCYEMSNELEVTKDIIFHGEDQPRVDCNNKEEFKKQPFNRYERARVNMADIKESLEKTRGEIRSLRTFFDK